MNERVTATVVEAGTRPINNMNNTTNEALSNLSEATQAREEKGHRAGEQLEGQQTASDQFQ